MSKVTTITDEKHAKRVVEAAVEDLAHARQWIWEHMEAWLPADGNAAPETRHAVEGYGAYASWWATVDAAIKVLDPGAANMFSPTNEADRQAMLQRIQEIRDARVARNKQG
jgi:hypothetical protein